MSKEEVPPPASFVGDPDKCEYSTVDECASIVSRVTLDQRHPVVSEEEASVNMCKVYSEPADSVSNAMPDISPYACFYGVSSHQVLKVGWLDKLSPQG